MIDLADINDVSIFAEQLGSRFRIETGPDDFVAAKLVKAEAIGARADSEELLRREPFSLLFEIEEGVELPQRTYQVCHETLGEMPLFLVPVGERQMESIFN